MPRVPTSRGPVLPYNAGPQYPKHPEIHTHQRPPISAYNCTQNRAKTCTKKARFVPFSGVKCWCVVGCISRHKKYYATLGYGIEKDRRGELGRVYNVCEGVRCVEAPERAARGIEEDMSDRLDKALDWAKHREPWWECRRCGQPVTNRGDAIRDACPGCKRFGQWAGARSWYPKGCMVIAGEVKEGYGEGSGRVARREGKKATRDRKCAK